jgi:cytoplasmic iron level regulating protein YaaA (DUF328/UPF0246 family)
MLAILSPAKTLDFESKLTTKKYTEPSFVDESSQLISTLKTLEPQDIASLMSISDNLAELNHRRYHEWQPRFDTPNFGTGAARPAILAFKGDVYLGLQGPTMSERDLTWAQKHIRILSGLHGLLRPLDRIHAYRLEMGTRLNTKHGANLYEFWGDKVATRLNDSLAEQHTGSGVPVLINLASNEYYKVLAKGDINARVINVTFKEGKEGVYRFLSFFAKKARGSMARYMVDQRVKSIRSLKAFDYDGYRYNAEMSVGDNWTFTRG